MIVCIQCSRTLPDDAPGARCSCQTTPPPARELTGFERRLLEASKRAGRFGRPLGLVLDEHAVAARRGALVS